VTDYPEHVVKVGAIADLDELLVADRLVDELNTLHRDVSSRIDATDNDDHDREIENDGDSDGIPRIKLKVKPLRRGIAKTQAVPKKFEGSKAPGTPDEISPPMPASGVTFEPVGIAEIPVYFRKKPKRRKGDGPRIRSRRARREAMRSGKKWFFTGDPCIYGHIADRLVSNGKCRECNRQDSERSNRLGLYR
jgi:hypothetical protein